MAGVRLLLIMASLQMLDDRRSFALVEEIEGLSKHFLREVTDLLLRPSSRLRQRENRRQLSCCQASVIGNAFGTSRMLFAISASESGRIGVSVSIRGLRNGEVQVQTDSEQGSALLQTVGGRCLEIIS